MIRAFFAVFDALFPPGEKSARQFGWIFVALIGFALVEGTVQTLRWSWKRWRREDE